MHLYVLVFVIGVLNVLVGYAIGVYWRYEPWPRRNTPGASRTPRSMPDDLSDRVAGIKEPIKESNQKLESCLSASPHADADEMRDPATQPKLGDVEALRRLVDKATANLADFTARLQHGNWDRCSRTTWSFVSELQEICEAYLRHLSDTAERLCDGDGDSREATVLSGEVQQVIVDQTAQLETTLSNLQYMDFDSGFSAAVKRLRMDTDNTLAVARRLQKALEPAAETTSGQDGASTTG